MATVLALGLLLSPPVPASAVSAMSGPTQNLLSGCVKTFHAGVDYFPDKSSFEYSSNLAVSYHDNYKVLTVKQPYPGGSPVSYVLVQCGTPAPSLRGALAGDEVIDIPVNRVIDYSETQLADFKLLGLTDDVVGVSNTAYVQESVYRTRIAKGLITSVAPSGQLDTEAAIGTHANLYLTEGVAAPGAQDAALEAAGIPEIQGADWLEQTPLGRAEWIKLVGIVTNHEKEANGEFSTIASAFHHEEALTADVRTRPTVFMGVDAAGTWYVPGGKSFEADFVRAAGGDYLWSHNTSTGNVSLSEESILPTASRASFWLNDVPRDGWQSLSQLETSDPVVASFPSVTHGKVFATLKEDNFQSGGNGYWEVGVERPDLVLADLIAILHPSLEPHHHFTFYEAVPKS